MNAIYNFLNFLDHPDVAYHNFKQMIKSQLNYLSVVRWAVTSKTGNFLEVADPNIQVKGIVNTVNPSKSYEKIKKEYELIKNSSNKINLKAEAIFETYENVLVIHRMHKNNPLDIEVLFLDDLNPEQIDQALLKAIKCGFNNLSKKIINTNDYNKNLNMESDQFLLLALKTDNLVVVQELLKNQKQRAMLNDEETIQKLVTLCYKFRLTEISILLINHGADPKSFLSNKDSVKLEHISSLTSPNHPIKEMVKKIDFNASLNEVLTEKMISVEATKKRKI